MLTLPLSDTEINNTLFSFTPTNPPPASRLDIPDPNNIDTKLLRRLN